MARVYIRFILYMMLVFSLLFFFVLVISVRKSRNNFLHPGYACSVSHQLYIIPSLPVSLSLFILSHCLSIYPIFLFHCCCCCCCSSLSVCHRGWVPMRTPVRARCCTVDPLQTSHDTTVLRKLAALRCVTRLLCIFARCLLCVLRAARNIAQIYTYTYPITTIVSSAVCNE